MCCSCLDSLSFKDSKEKKISVVEFPCVGGREEPLVGV